MDFEELNQRAYEQEDIREGLLPTEEMVYPVLKKLYEQNEKGFCTRECGIEIKRELEKLFSRSKEYEREWFRSVTTMKLLRRHEKPEVRAVAEEVDDYEWE